MDVRHYAFLPRQPSASLKTHEHFWGMPKRGLAFLLANVMFWQPMWAQAEGIVVATPGTSLGQAGNGVPIVNIATPNGTGLSHNQFHDYNVGTQGVILNNVANQTGATQLGGIIVGNPNLTNRVAAQTILNEVVGGSPSQLRGYTEVAGQSARVIVANPYGISCNGCGFINTARVTLTTGKPVLDGGRLDRFQVDQGSVSIDGAGLNANNVDSFEIITRSAKINAEIQAKNLTIVAGRNDVNAQSLNATARADDGSAKPQLAIDSSALGGMYAGAIKLVGTEAGVGVKLAGNLAASGGDIQIDANGHLSLVQTSAAGAVNVKAASLDAQGPVYARAVNVQTQGNLTNQQTLAARDGIVLSAAGQLTNNGIIEAGVNADNSRNTTGDVSLTAQNLNTSGNSVIASRNLTVITSQTLSNQGGTLSGQTSAQISAGTFNNQQNGRLLSNGTLTVSADQLLNTLGLISSAGDQTLHVTTLNNQQGSISSQGGLSLSGTTLNNTSGSLRTQKNLNVQLTGDFNNTQGLLTVSAASLANRLGSLSSAGQLSLTSAGLIGNQGGQLVTDGGIDLHSASLDNSHAGSISGKGALNLSTGTFDNSHNGRLSGGSTLALTAGQVTNQDSGRIASAGAMVVSLTGMDLLGGQLYSNTSLTLDLNHGQLNNQNGLINAPILVLKNLNGVVNQNGEISSAQAFTLAADSLDNSGGKLLSNQSLTLRINQALTNIKGLIAAAVIDAHTGSFDNSARGNLTSQGALVLSVDGQLNNQNQGLINASGQLTISSANLNNQDGLLLGSAIALDFAALGGDLNNNGGLITTSGQLTVDHLRDLNNQMGEISSSQSFSLTGRTLDNTAGKLISSDQLTLNAVSLLNPTGLISGWQGLSVSGGSLDNHNNGTLSSRSADVSVTLSGALLNSANGALVSKNALTVNAASVDNTGGILSSGTDQTLTVSGLLGNDQNGLIDSGAALTLQALSLSNIGGTISAQQPLSLSGTRLDNTTGSLVGKAAVTLNLLGVLTNTNGKLASAGALLIQHASQVNNQGGQLVSQDLLTLLIGDLDNSNRGTVAASGELLLTATGAVQNNADGLIYSQNADVQLSAVSLANGKGTLQSQGAMAVTLSGDIDNQSGRIIAQTGDLTLHAGNVDSRGGVLSSLQAAFRAHLSGSLKNGYDLNNNQGGITQAQSLSITALGGIDNDGGRISAQTGDALITTANFDNRNGGLYASGKVKVTADNFDNSASNAGGQIAGSQIDLSLAGALNNQQGIIESDSTLGITAASINNQSGKLRALGASGVTQLTLRGRLDNRSGTLESANTDLNLNAGSFLNTGGSVLHVGTGTLGISTANIMGAGAGTLVTRGGLTLNADTWTNSSVIQAGRLNVNVNNFNQTATGQLLASDSFTGNGVNWFNDGLLASSGSLALNLSGAYRGNGSVSSVGSLGLSAAQIDLTSAASITAGASATISSSASLTNLGRLTSAEALAIDAAYLNNQGTLGSGANLRINASTILNQNGLIFSGGDMQLRTDNFTNRYADVYGLGNVSIAKDDKKGWSASISNVSASIESGGDLSLAASSIENRKDVFQTTGGLVSGYIGVQCYTCSSLDPLAPVGSESYAVWVENYQSQITQDSASATMTAGRNFLVSGGVFLNQASTLSAGKDLTFNLQTFTNQGASVGDYSVRRSIALSADQQGGDFGLWASIMAYNAANDPSYDPGSLGYVGGNDPTFSRPNMHFWNSTSNESIIQVAPHPGGKNLETYTRFGSVYVSVTAGSLWYDFALPHYGDGVQVAAPTVIQSATPFDTIVTYNSPSSYANAVVQAGGSVQINATQNLTNSVVREGITTGPATSRLGSTQLSGQPAPTIVNLNAQLPPNLAQQQVNPLTLSGFSLPTGQNGLFRLSTASTSTQTSTGPQSWTMGGASISNAERQQGLPDVTSTSGPVSIARVQGLPSSASPSSPQKYLIETNPVLTDLKQFMSSDYLLTALGYNPDDSAKRLGDGFYEQRLIQQAVVAGTGQAFIGGQASNEAQFKYLMDNAVASKDALNLSVGVSLTSEQVAALTHDIVWMESEVVDGQTVLVPVLYLANANNRLAASGALIQGSDVTLIAGRNLGNAGILKATNTLSATAGNDQVNSGLIQAGNRLDLLAGNDIVNKSGGIITGRDVNLTSVMGDVINERTVTQSGFASNGYRQHLEYMDSASRIEATNDLKIDAGRDFISSGSALVSGRDTKIEAGRDVSILAAQQQNSAFTGTTSSSVKQFESTVSAGRDFSISAGRDFTAVASQMDAKRDIDLSAAENMVISSGADETHSYYKSKSTTAQEDHVKQVASTVTAGGNVTFSAGKDMALVSSRITAGEEAYLVAGGQLDVWAAQDSDYSLYDKKKKGSFGSSLTRRDEVTKVTNVGTQITAGGDLTLKSSGDQRYQVARLESGGDITLQSDGSITFEAVKDVNQERHEKSKSSLAWMSMQGEGHTDETLRQTQLIAHGDIAIKAVEGLHIDIKQIDQNTVSQTIDAMVQADPQLAWLKEAEKRGDVDWRLVKETHDAFKYSSSGLGQGAMLAIVIIVTVLTAGTGTAAAIGATASTAATSAAVAAGASATVAASIGTAAAAAASAAYTAVITQAVISTINNKGDLAAALKDVTSPKNLKGYVTTGLVAGFAAGFLDKAFSVSPENASSATHGFKLGDLEGFTKFAGYTLTEKGFTAITSTAINGGSFKDSLAQAALSSVADVLSASIYNKLGGQLEFTGIPAKVGAHAIVGGLLAEAAGGSFRTGALAAGANEAFVTAVGSSIFAGPMHEQLLVLTSQLLGLVVAAGAGGSVKDQQVASWLAGQATTHNFLGHEQQEALAKKLDETCHGDVACIKEELRKIKPLADSQNGFNQQEQEAYDNAHEVLLDKLLANCESASCKTVTAIKMEMAALSCADISCMREEAGAIQKGQYISQGQWEKIGLDFLDDAGRVLAAIVPGLGAGKAPAAPDLHPLRKAYVEQVGMLEEIALSMRAAGATPEQVAREVSGLRRNLGVEFKNATPPDKLAEIYARNIEKYGDKLGPTIEWLRARGDSWEKITESASRAGGKDLGF